jgi:hypothetical protein
MTNQTQNKSFILYQEYHKNISILTQNQKGDLLDAIFSYNQGIEIELDPIVKMAFSFIKSDLDRNKAKYQNIIERNKINGVSGGRPKNPKKPKKPSGLFGNPEKPKETLNDNGNVNVNVDKDDNKNEDDNLNNNYKGVEIETIKTKRFIKPTIQEIKDYCLERKNNVNAESFSNYYEARGWKLKGIQMKDWKACVRTWEGNNYGNNQVITKRFMTPQESKEHRNKEILMDFVKDNGGFDNE